MTHPTLTFSPPRFIDTAPLTARYELLIATMMALLSAGLHDDVLRVSLKVLRLTQAFIRADRHNRLLRRKREMLANPAWRMRVLRELGGLRRLKLWDAARLRAKGSPARQIMRDVPKQPAWRNTPERRAESERLKAPVRDCAKACVPENIMRDRVRMDFDGMFRLAPLPRTPHGKRQVRIYTAADIVDYRYNAVPFATVTGLGPATVWPAEFYAAMLVDKEKSSEPNTLPTLSLIPAKAGIQISKSDIWIPNQVWDERDEREEIMSLPAFIGEKPYRVLFENPV